jgi:hypothetical protein
MSFKYKGARRRYKYEFYPTDAELNKMFEETMTAWAEPVTDADLNTSWGQWKKQQVDDFSKKTSDVELEKAWQSYEDHLNKFENDKIQRVQAYWNERRKYSKRNSRKKKK